MSHQLKKIGINQWRLQKTPAMKVDAVVWAKEELVESLKKDRSLEQLAQAASLPHLLSPVVAMPDVHEGFGLPIGGVMAATNLVSAGAVGMDINCGVRLLLSQMEFSSKTFSPQTLKILIKNIEKLIPVGLGGKRKEKAPVELEKVITKGTKALQKANLGSKEDLDSIEENGCLKGAEMENLSPKALQRAEKQLGTLGSGNHFIEIQVIKEIFDRNLAKKWGLFKNQIGVMIHSGSRALGHQTCLDYTQKFAQEQARYKLKAPSRNLASLPADSPTGQAYLSAMAGAVNFAFANRQLMGHFIREVFLKFFKTKKAKLTLLYDVAHNIAKWENHQNQKVLVHRKGATRALPAGHPQNPKHFLSTGHPAIVPGSMGTSSYILVGLPKSKQTYHSVNHGAGRAMSRTQAKRTISKKDFEKLMDKIIYNKPFHTIVDEAPQAYKDINLVVDTLTEAQIAAKVARLEPLAVIKGD